MSEWIEHKGGMCPVDQGVMVEVKTKNDCKSVDWGNCFMWQYDNVGHADNHIIAYRLVDEPITATNVLRQREVFDTKYNRLVDDLLDAVLADVMKRVKELMR